MSPQAIGVMAGGVFGLLNMGVLRFIATRMEGTNPTPQQRRTASLLRAVSFLDVIVFTVLGYFLVPMFME